MALQWDTIKPRLYRSQTAPNRTEQICILSGCLKIAFLWCVAVCCPSQLELTSGGGGGNCVGHMPGMTGKLICTTHPWYQHLVSALCTITLGYHSVLLSLLRTTTTGPALVSVIKGSSLSAEQYDTHEGGLSSNCWVFCWHTIPDDRPPALHRSNANTPLTHSCESNFTGCIAK